MRPKRSTNARFTFAIFAFFALNLAFSSEVAAKRRRRPRVTSTATDVQTTPALPPLDAEGRPRALVLFRGWDRERFTVTPESSVGGFGADDLAIAREAFSYRDGDDQHEVHPRLLELAYRAYIHFGASEVRLTSGFRPGRVRSRHTHGRAMDISLPGVDYRRLADFMRTQGFVGVGVYPRSGFVHVDVRSSSYFWIDHSRPGRRGRGRPMRMDEAAQADLAARARGEVPDEDVAAAEEQEEEIADRVRERRAQRRRPAARHRRARRAQASVSSTGG